MKNLVTGFWKLTDLLIVKFSVLETKISSIAILA